ncbi:MAG TPA: hypothetical protein VFS00_19520, partial [Polyangiaceae bacterium]|nr:hypothetical protein [Polyangiaceae bacterium]
VWNYDERTGSGTGFVVDDLTPRSLYDVLGWSLWAYHNRAADLERMRRFGMSQDFGWSRAAAAYEDVYRAAYAARRGHPFDAGEGPPSLRAPASTRRPHLHPPADGAPASVRRPHLPPPADEAPPSARRPHLPASADEAPPSARRPPSPPADEAPPPARRPPPTPPEGREP